MSLNKNRLCPACSSEKAKIVGNKNDFEMAICQSCRTLFTAKLPTFDEAQDYDEYYQPENFETPNFVIKRTGEIISGFDKYRQTNKLLDVGFGAGTILKAAREKKWDVFGVEVSKPAIEYAKSQGFEVFHGELQKAPYPENSFDVVTASEIIEHLSDTKSVLQGVFRILRPGGLFWATSPSARGLTYQAIGLSWTNVAPPEHIQLFSKQGINKMLREIGFTKIEVKTHALNPFEIINFWRSKFSSKKDESPQTFDRNATGYQINEALMKSHSRQFVKNSLNNTLNLLGAGDSLKIFAEK